jgi:predicted acylesterase/phospholipase RssA
MFGAYQAGAWEVLSETFQPDLVVGVSIGSLNGWAIAGGCRPSELTQRWLELHEASKSLNGRKLHAWVRDLYERYQPKVPYGVVVTDLFRLQTKLFTTPGITWEHLAASCAIFGLLPQMRIEGRLYSDGGLLHPVPLWAACQMGATDILAINVLPRMPGSLLQTCVQAFRAVAPKPPGPAPDARIQVLEPPRLLGSPREAIYWNERNAEKWIEIGRQHARAMLTKHTG